MVNKILILTAITYASFMKSIYLRKINYIKWILKRYW